MYTPVPSLPSPPLPSPPCLRTPTLTEAQLTIIGLSLGVGLVLLLLCVAWCCFCVSVCKDKHTQAKVRKRWRNAIERARQLSRRTRRGTQQRGEVSSGMLEGEVSVTMFLSRQVHAPRGEAVDGNRRCDNPQRVCSPL